MPFLFSKTPKAAINMNFLKMEKKKIIIKIQPPPDYRTINIELIELYMNDQNYRINIVKS